MALRKIPKSLKLSMMTEAYVLRGIAAFDAPDINGNADDFESIGHYKGFCFRIARG